MLPTEALRHLSIEALLLPILIQLVVIILVARLFANLFRRIGQPMVVGEICAGIILGPSLFGALFPRLFTAIFYPSLPDVPPDVSRVLFTKIFAVFSQIGLILLLFMIGLEFDYSHLRERGRSALTISLTGIALPFALGLGIAYVIHPNVEAHPEKGIVNFTGFALFLGVALSITAIPILGRIMMELDITRTRLGVITITAAAFDDAAGWILLATVAAFVKSMAQMSYDPLVTVWMILETVAFGLGMLFVVRPLMIRWIRWTLRNNHGNLSTNALAVLLAMLFLCAIVTNLIGIFAIFGAFTLGAVLADQHEFREAVASRMREIVTAFFLPIFFTNTGLRTEIGTLDSAMMWGLCGLVIAAALLGKFGGCGLAARWSGFSPRESAIIGVMMNTRALMELIVINVGYELGVIPRSVFCMLVLMAVLTTVMTSPILLRLMPGTEIEPNIRASGFLERNNRRSEPATVAAGSDPAS